MLKKLIFTSIALTTLFVWQLDAQESPTIFLGGGTNTFKSDVDQSVFLNPDFGLNVGFFTPFWKKEKFNIGLNLSGSYTFGNNDFSNLEGIVPILPEDGLITETFSNKVNQSLLQLGVGPQLNFKLGNKFWLSPIFKTGYFNFNQDEIIVTQTNSFNENSFSTVIFTQDQVNESGLFVNTALRLSFQLTDKWGIWAEGNYFLASVNTVQNTFIPLGEPNEQGEYNWQQIVEGGQGNQDFIVTETETSLNNFGVNFGIAFSFGTGSEKPQHEREEKLTSDRREERKQQRKEEQPREERKKSPTDSKKPMNSGSVVFTNPSKKDNEEQQKIIAVLPKNNSNFKDASEIKNFTWEVIGSKILNPQYILEVTKINNYQQPLRTYTEKTTQTSLNATQIFKEQKLSEGRYRWRVTELTTGKTSQAKTLLITSCYIKFSTTNEEIECLGFEGDNRKLKICFDSYYLAPSIGDLTFANTNTGSGLTVFDQTNAPLSYILVNPNTSLVPQNGEIPSTITYCFEVVVDPDVTSIGYRLQGDELDSSPLTCQHVSQDFNELPDCLCDVCDELELSFDDFTISLNGTNGNQFNFEGDINVNVPINSIEFQIQSYSYTASPSACSSGVGSIEESGMILMPGSTINGSTSLILTNETVSGLANSNNHTTKNIKYNTLTPITGAIPVNLTIGLPGPISGLDPSSCTIEYTVCLKVRVFYGNNSCKSCVFAHCFTFNNQ